MNFQETDNLWFEIALVSFVFALGNILLGHFEEKTPKIKRVAKFIATLSIVCLVSYFFGRSMTLAFLAITLIAVVSTHLWWLSKKGVKGWTAEPKDKYYRLRGWKDDTISVTQYK